MRRFVVLFVAVLLLASSAFAERKRELEVQPKELLEAPISAHAEFVPVFLDSNFLRRRAVASTLLKTPEAQIFALPFDDQGNYHVGFSAWHPVPVNTTMWTYSVYADGTKKFLYNTVVTQEHANMGWAGYVLGGYTWGEPLPAGVVGFEVDFTGAENFIVSTKVGGLPPAIEIYPGIIFINGGFSPTPVAALDGKGCPVVNGAVVPPVGYTGFGVIVTVCHITSASPVVTSLCLATTATVLPAQ